MKVSSGAISLLLLFTPYAYGALGAEETAALNAYIVQQAGMSKQWASILVGVVKETTSRVNHAEQVCKDKLPMIESESENLNRQLNQLRDNINFIQSMKSSDDQEWREKMHEDVTAYCCGLRNAQVLTGGGFYQKLKHTGGDPIPHESLDIRGLGGGRAGLRRRGGNGNGTGMGQNGGAGRHIRRGGNGNGGNRGSNQNRAGGGGGGNGGASASPAPAPAPTPSPSP